MKKNLLFTALLLTVALTVNNCSNQPEDPDFSQIHSMITAESVMSHINLLASDSLMGRAPATPGEEMTVEYLINEFEQAGLVGGMPDGSFIQKVPVISQNTDQNSVMRINQNGNNIHSFNYRSDMMAWPAAGQEEVNIRGAELVYVGYGIIAPEEDWDDYKGQDMTGKILVFKNSDPSTFPDKFAGNTRLYYGRWSYKYEIAEELGALGAIIVHTFPTAGYGWNVVEGSWSRERFALADEMSAESPTELNAWLTFDSSEAMFRSAGLDLRELLDAAEDPNFEPVPLEGLTLDIDMQATYNSLELMNVLAVLPGNDRNLRDEYVVFSAHHDHLGVGSPVEGDSIYNGALDNASGTSGLIELAKAYASVQSNLRRSLMFAAVGGEESGLLGSRYLAFNSPIHVGKFSANINIDMLNGIGETEDIIVVGKGRTSIDNIMVEEAAKMGRNVLPDQDPGQGFYYRSDHFSFARVGIPAFYPNPGVTYIGEDDNFVEEVVRPFMQKIYHTVHDRPENIISMEGAAKDLHLIFNVGYRVANADNMQTWTPGDEFEATRLRALEEAANL